MKKAGIFMLLFFNFQLNVDIRKIDSKLFDKINATRVENKCGILLRDENLDKAATNQAEYIANKEVLEHIQNENAKTKTLLDRVTLFSGNEFSRFAENLVFTTIPKKNIDVEIVAEKLKTLWIKSPNHFKNIKNCEYNYTGFGFALNKSKTKIYVVQIFGKK